MKTVSPPSRFFRGIFSRNNVVIGGVCCIIFGAATSLAQTLAPTPKSQRELRAEYYDRYNQFREGRKSSDLGGKGNRFTNILELHDEKAGGLHVDHGTAGTQGSQLEKVVETYAKKDTVIQDKSGNSATIKYNDRDPLTQTNTQSFFDYVRPHENVDKTAIETDINVNGRSIRDRMERDEHGYRRVMKDGARTEVQGVGKDYAKKAMFDGSECATNPSARGCNTPTGRLPNRDWMVDEGNWLKTMVMMREEDGFQAATVERINNGVKINDPDPRKNFDLQQDVTDPDRRNAIAANRKDKNSPVVVAFSSRRLLKPDFSVTEKTPAAREMIDLLGLKATTDKITPLAKSVGDRAYAEWARQYNSAGEFRDISSFGDLVNWAGDPDRKRQIVAQFETELDKIKNNPTEFNLLDLKQLLNTNSVCKDASQICVYDPEAERLVPFQQFYKIQNNNYAVLVNNLEELVQRDNFITMTNPLLVDRSPLGRTGNPDQLDGRFTDTPGQSEAFLRQQLKDKVATDIQNISRILQQQREIMSEFVSLGATKDDPSIPIPSPDEILVSMMTGRQLGTFGAPSIPTNAAELPRNNPLDPQSGWIPKNNENETLINVNAQGDRRVQSAGGVPMGDTMTGYNVAPDRGVTPVGDLGGGLGISIGKSKPKTTPKTRRYPGLGPSTP